MDTLIGGTKGLARTGSGLIVPAGLADEAKVAKGSVTRDTDGRRRVVYTNQERRAVDRVVKLLRADGFGVILGCVGAKLKDGSAACGQPMKPEGADTDDAGYGCNCSRIHFRRT